jgi:hypothetical protein
MKSVILILSCFLSFSAFSQSLDTQTFIYDGSSNSKELFLRSEKMRTEYRTEERHSTCYRQKILRYKVSCSGYPGSAGQGRTGTGQVCNTVPVYGTVPYACVETVNIPFEVKEYDVEAKVVIDVTKASSEITADEKITAKLVGDKLSFEVIGSEKFLVFQKKQDIRSSFDGSVKSLNGVLSVELIEVSQVKKSLNQLSKINLINDSLNFSLGQLDHISFSLKVSETKRLSKETILFDRKLTSSEIEVSRSSESKNDVTINIKNLGLELREGKFKISLEANVNSNDILMNVKQFEKLKKTKEITIKN